MKESGWYPPGAEFDPNAPYNQMEPEEKEYKVEAGFYLRTTSEVWSSSYDEFDNLVDPQRDWCEQHYTPLEIIKHCRALAEEMLENGCSKYPEHVLRHLIEDCDGWEDIEQEIDQL